MKLRKGSHEKIIRLRRNNLRLFIHVMRPDDVALAVTTFSAARPFLKILEFTQPFLFTLSSSLS